MGAVIESRKDQVKKVTAVTAKLVAKPIGEMVDDLATLRDRKRELEAQVKEIEGEYAALEEQLMERLKAEKTDASRGSKASCSITKNVVANVIDWDAFHEYIRKNKYFHLLQRRVSDTAYRELLEAGKKVAGVEPFTKERLNLRSL